MAKRNGLSRWMKSLQRLQKIPWKQQQKWAASSIAASQKAIKQQIQQALKKPKPKRTTGTHLPSNYGGEWLQSWAITPQGRMVYGLYLPPQSPTSKPVTSLPIVVMLHGCTQTANEFANSTQMNALAAKKGFAVLYPQQSKANDRRRCWRWYQKSTQQGAADADAVMHLVHKVISQHPIDTNRVYLAGLSAGAGLAHSIALHFPCHFAAIALHSAPVFGVADSALHGLQVMQQGSSHGWANAINQLSLPKTFPQIPVLILHGTADLIVRPINAYQVAQQWCLTHRLQQPPRVSVKSPNLWGRTPFRGYSITDFGPVNKPLVRLYSIEGLGHAWNGGGHNIRFADPLGQNTRSSANFLIWAFFTGKRKSIPQ
jgi:poly(hydroxyalkanoate) depolymerase family esterase